MANPQAATLERQKQAQGSITIRRIRNGDTLYLTFGSNGIPLYQTVDTEGSGAYAPDWTKAANQPLITPDVKSALGATVGIASTTAGGKVTAPVWKYNNTPISFGSTPDAAGWYSGSVTYKSKTYSFKMNSTSFALMLVSNLADPANLANGTLTFECTANAGGGSYALSKSIDVILQSAGASGYYAAVTASCLTLDKNNTSTTLSVSLFCAGKPVASFYPKWRKDNNTSYIAAYNGNTSITVNRSGVDGAQLYVAECYLSQPLADSAANCVAIAGVTVIDAADSYQVRLTVTSAKSYIDESNGSVTVHAELIDNKGNPASVPGNVTWRLDIVDRQTFRTLDVADSSSDTDTIIVQRKHTDRTVGGVMTYSDVDVMADATWGPQFSQKFAVADCPPLFWRQAAAVQP